MKLIRYHNNPILKPTKNKWENHAVLNPGVVFYKNQITMLYRAIGRDKHYTSRLGYAVSTDGVTFKRFAHPIFKLEEDYEKYGTEDPRITKINGVCYITYVVLRNPANSGDAIPQTAVASTRDFKNFKRYGKITSPGADDKDVLLFPEKMNHTYHFLHRPNLWTGEKYETVYPSIWMSTSKRFKKLWHPELLMKPELSWEELKIGGGCPPIRTKKGWLVIYHGVDDELVYRVGAFLLDLKHPKRVIGKLKEPLLEPKKEYEIVGTGERYKGKLKKVVFPTGAIIKDNNLLVYYGCADKYISLAHCNLEELLNCFKR